MEQWLTRFQTRTGHKLGQTAKAIAQSLQVGSFSEVEDFGTDVLRRIALAGPGMNAAKITKERLAQWQERFRPNATVEAPTKPKRK